MLKEAKIMMNFVANNDVDISSSIEIVPHVFDNVNMIVFTNLSQKINDYILIFEVECINEKNIRIASLLNYSSCFTGGYHYCIDDRVLQIEDEIYHHINKVAMNNDSSIMTLWINTLQESIVIVTNEEN